MDTTIDVEPNTNLFRLLKDIKSRIDEMSLMDSNKVYIYLKGSKMPHEFSKYGCMIFNGEAFSLRDIREVNQIYNDNDSRCKP